MVVGKEEREKNITKCNLEARDWLSGGRRFTAVSLEGYCCGARGHPEGVWISHGSVFEGTAGDEWRDISEGTEMPG